SSTRPRTRTPSRSAPPTMTAELPEDALRCAQKRHWPPAAGDVFRRPTCSHTRDARGFPAPTLLACCVQHATALDTSPEVRGRCVGLSILHGGTWYEPGFGCCLGGEGPSDHVTGQPDQP